MYNSVDVLSESGSDGGPAPQTVRPEVRPESKPEPRPKKQPKLQPKPKNSPGPVLQEGPQMYSMMLGLGLFPGLVYLL